MYNNKQTLPEGLYTHTHNTDTSKYCTVMKKKIPFHQILQIFKALVHIPTHAYARNIFYSIHNNTIQYSTVGEKIKVRIT